MLRRLDHRRLTGWIALMAMLLVSGAPTLQGLVESDSARWGQFCATVDEAAASSAPATGDTGQAGVTPHCPLCTLQQQGLAPPPSALGAARFAAGATTTPVLVLAAPAGNSPWRSAQPRAPPRFSTV
jgi:hypothetical protein